MRQAGQQPPPWHEQDEVDSTRVSKTSFCAVGKNDQYLSSVIGVRNSRNLQTSFGF